MIEVGLKRLGMDKKTARGFAKLQKVRGLSDEGRILFARSLAATPDETLEASRELSPRTRSIHACWEEEVRARES